MGSISADVNMLTDSQFKLISSFALERAGLEIPSQKNAMVCARVAKRVRDLKLPSLQSYCELISSSGQQQEMEKLISILTTNVTRFYRESHHFKSLREVILPELVTKAISGGSVRIWSAGCSEGMELLTIGIEILKQFPEANNYKVCLLGTDIDTKIVESARKAEYRPIIEEQLEPADLHRFFVKTSTGYRASPALRQMTTYNTLNLHDYWPMTQKFDIIFCRNVVIYFDQSTRDVLWPRFAQQLNSNGYLFLGHSERISGPGETSFKLSGTTTYQLSSLSPAQKKSDRTGELTNGIT